MILVAKFHPRCGSRFIGNANFVDIARKIILIIPTPDGESKGALQVERGATPDVFGGEFTVDIKASLTLLIGVDYVDPCSCGERWTLHIAVGEIAIGPNVRGAGVLHHHFALRFFVPPSDQSAVRFFGSEPQFGGVRAGAGGEAGNFIPTGDTYFP